LTDGFLPMVQYECLETNHYPSAN